MAIDKSLKQHYEMQGGVKNYLGKQKMVKAPKHWLSKPGHVKAKLAYITDEEEQILIDKNLYGSLRGRPNIGPAGLPSLQGGDFGSGGGGSSGDGGGGNGSHDRGGWQHHRAAAPKPASPRALEPKDDPITRHHGSDTPVQKLEQKILDQLQAKEKEKFERDQDYMDLKAKAPTTLIPKTKTITYDKGNPFTDELIPTTVKSTQTLFDPRTSQNTLLDRGGIFSNFDPKEMAKNQAKKMVRNKVMKELGLAGLNPLIGIGSWLMGKFAPGKKAALTEKLKSTIKPAFDPDSLLGTADWQGEKKRNKTFHEGEGGDKQQVSTVEESISGKKALGINLEDLRKRQSIMKTALDEGWYTDNEGRTIQLTDEQKMTLTNIVSQIDDYLIDPRAMAAYGGRIDKALGGRSRDI